MVKDEEWALPRRKPITEEVLDRAIRAEEAAVAQEHHARDAWFDQAHSAVMLKLTDGRVFGAETGFIPSLHDVSPEQLDGLHASADGAYLIVPELDLHMSVDGLVTRIMEASPSTIRRSGARLAGSRTSTAKAVSSARNGQLGGRPVKGKVRA